MVGRETQINGNTVACPETDPHQYDPLDRVETAATVTLLRWTGVTQGRVWLGFGKAIPPRKRQLRTQERHSSPGKTNRGA